VLLHSAFADESTKAMISPSPHLLLSVAVLIDEFLHTRSLIDSLVVAVERNQLHNTSLSSRVHNWH
jgi:hypothetical protein